MREHSEVETAALVSGYLRYAEGLRVPNSPDLDESSDEDAWEEVSRIIQDGPSSYAFKLLVELLKRAPDSDLDVYAAGPLEELLRRHGAVVIEDVEREAESDDRFRWALGYTWLQSDDLPAEILRRIVAASGGQLRVMDTGPKRAGGEPAP